MAVRSRPGAFVPSASVANMRSDDLTSAGSTTPRRSLRASPFRRGNRSQPPRVPTARPHRALQNCQQDRFHRVAMSTMRGCEGHPKEAADQAHPDPGSWWLLPELRVRPLRHESGLPPSRSNAEELLYVREERPLTGSVPGGGQEMRSPVRKLSRRGRDRDHPLSSARRGHP